MSLVAVIGGGPAGMMAAAVASKRGHKTVLIEKNKMLGKKLLITGKGRCNLTNDADVEEFIKNTPVNASFLYSAFYSFTNQDLVNLINKLGVKKVSLAGFDGFSNEADYYDVSYSFAGNESYKLQNNEKVIHGLIMIKEEMKLQFLTESLYQKGLL
jgi:thioredoxin reductase